METVFIEGHVKQHNLHFNILCLCKVSILLLQWYFGEVNDLLSFYYMAQGYERGVIREISWTTMN